MYIADSEPVEFTGNDWKIYKRQPCEIYTRVMGYIRPASGYNPGKKSEFYSRRYFEESKADNSDFIRKYWNKWQ